MGDREDTTEAASQIVLAMEREWANRVMAGRASETLELYTEDALFFGSTSRLYSGASEIAEYFDDVPAGYVQSVEFSDRQVRRPRHDLILSSAYVDFRIRTGGRDEDWFYRISFVLLRTTVGWRIAQHHASPREN